MSTCRKCTTSVGMYLTFCHKCGARLKIDRAYDPKWKRPNRGILSNVGRNLSAKNQRWEKMTQSGSEELEEELRELLLRDPANIELGAELALALSIRALFEEVDLGDYKSAQHTYSSAIEVEPDNPKWRLGRAGVYRAWESRVSNLFSTEPYEYNPEEAERLSSLAKDNYAAVLAIEPAHIEALIGRATLNGRLEASDEDCKAALSILNRAISADENDGESLEERAKIFADLEMNDKVLEDYKAAYNLASRAPLAQQEGQQRSFKLRSLQIKIDAVQRRI